MTFEEALTVFANSLALTIEDTLHSTQEKRFLMIGYSHLLRLLTVVSTERHQKTRIISARLATKKKEISMNKESKTDSTTDDLDNYDLSTSVRGKYYEQYQALKGEIPVTIETKDGIKQVIIHTIKTKASLDESGNLKANIITDILPGEYEITIIIEESQS